MFRSRLFTVVAIAGVLAFGTAALTQCSPGIDPTKLPPPSTTTTTTRVPPIQGQLTVAPSDGAGGAVISVQGSGCISDAGHVEVFLATAENPSARLVEVQTGVVSAPPGDWSVDLTIPEATAPGSDYLIEAQCWGDGTPFGLGGMQVEYFAYNAEPFTVD